MKTIKINYRTSEENKNIILKYMKNQNNVIKFIYNRLLEDNKLTQKQLTSLSNSMNNIFVDSWFKQSAIYKAKDLLETNDKVIFGGKKLFHDRIKNKINKEEFQIKKLMPIYLIGESNRKGNRKFDFRIIEQNLIIFKLNFETKINLQLPKLRKNFRKELITLQELMENQKIPVLVSLDLENIYISFEEQKLNLNINYEKVNNRIMSIDLNPNYIGYSIIDWKSEDQFTIIKKEVLSIKDLNDKQFNLKKMKISSNDKLMKKIVNKRHFEIFEITKYLSNIAKYYKIEYFGMDSLNIKSSKKCQGAKYNRLVNNFWNRNKLVDNLTRRLKLNGIKVISIPCQYSSVVGNLIYNQNPDMIASSIEMNRRCFILVNKLDKKDIIFPDFKKSIVVIKTSLEECFGNKIIIESIKDWKQLYNKIKNLKLRYRVSLENKYSKVFRLFNRKSFINCYQFI